MHTRRPLSPIYDYYCKKCDLKIEDVFHYKEPTRAFCPYCKSKVVRMPAAPSIRFKGDGWESNARKDKENKDE